MTVYYPKRIMLAHTPTPIMKLKKLSAELGAELYVKRDDITGLELSGNKVRKLEFLIAEAVDVGADTVVTCGGVQSNHCRATAADSWACPDTRLMRPAISTTERPVSRISCSCSLEAASSSVEVSSTSEVV